jgi:urate oxidase
MKITLGQNAYGKNAVNLTRITRHNDYNEIKQISVNIAFEGEFESAHTTGDNTLILPTDTMKNTVYALAKDRYTSSIEEYGIDLAHHFLSNNPQVTEVRIEISEHLWNRLEFDGKHHQYAFISGGFEKHTAQVIHSKKNTSVSSGIKDLLILKTYNSAFEKYIKDQFTTLKETDDRIMSTQCEISWLYTTNKLDFTSVFNKIRAVLLETFADHKSLSVQHTLYAMGENVLKEIKEVKNISFVMPNKHHILFNLEQFGMDNNNEIFIATDEPYGMIRGTVTREE